MFGRCCPRRNFNEPWGMAVAPDGSVYVADTWNHRIQKFTPDGKFLLMFGFFGQAESPEAFWGPRDVVVDREGRVFVTDTGNKRVVVFDSQGQFITQFGTTGVGLGQLDEPVGIAVCRRKYLCSRSLEPENSGICPELTPRVITPQVLGN